MGQYLERREKNMFRGTTILALRHKGQAAMAGDGQVTFQEKTIMKSKARKIRRLYKDSVIAGFAGSVADAFTLLEKFEGRLTEFHGNLVRASVELAKEWRTDKMLRELQALLVVLDRDSLLIISGTGEVIEPDDGIAAVGSGGAYALAAARALVEASDLPAEDIARRSLQIAASICVYTNENIEVESI